MRSRLNDSSTNEHDDEEEEEEEEDGGGSSFRSERGGSLRIRQGRSEMLLGGRNGNGNGRRSKRRTSRNGVGIDSFEIMRVLGKGCAGKVRETFSLCFSLSSVCDGLIQSHLLPR